MVTKLVSEIPEIQRKFILRRNKMLNCHRCYFNFLHTDLIPLGTAISCLVFYRI